MQTDQTPSHPTNFLLPSHLSSSSSFDQTDELDGHPSLDNEPLLPQYEIHPTPRKRRLEWSTYSENRSLLLALGGFAFAASTILLWLFCRGLIAHTSIVTQGVNSTIASKVDLNETRHFLSNLSAVNEGYIPFPSSVFSPLYTPTPLQHTLSTSSFPSSACLDRFVSQGELCEEMRNRWSAGEEQPKLDLIWTWTNGSQGELMADWKDKESLNGEKLGKRLMKGVKRLLGGNMLKHFREHDELRFSIRSALASLPSASISVLHLVVGDTPPYRLGEKNEVTTLDRTAQIPHWLDLSTVNFASVPSKDSPVLRIHPHSELFKTGNSNEKEALLWRDSVLPSFNSLAIESQLANLDLTSRTAVYLNDDFFLNEPLSVADFESPLTGPVFRMQRDLLVSGVDPANDRTDPDSEWKSLGTAGHLLNRRFGVRKRPYLVHVAKAVSMPTLKELQSVFIDELTQTAEARFRGRGLVEAQTMHLLAHYTVEKHREALLWSFLVARSNPSSTGFYSPLERELLLQDLGYDFTKSTLRVYTPRRSSLSHLQANFEKTGLPPAKETTFEFTSQDGYAYFGLEATIQVPEYKKGWPSFSSETPNELGEETPVCIIDFEKCFGSEFLDTTKQEPVSVGTVFKRILFELPSCGDCLIAKLVRSSSEKGVEAFLPGVRGDGEPEVPSSQVEVPAIGLESTNWSDVNFELPLNGSSRDFAISLIQRYSYTFGSSSAAFRSIKGGGEPLTEMLNALSISDISHQPPAFLALNDDIYSPRLTVAHDVKKRLGEWFRRVWPEPSRWETQR